jgi:hypothetical protein
MIKAFTQKKVKLSGNMSVAMKLNQVFSSVINDKKKSPSASAPAKPAAAASAAPAPGLTQTTTRHKSGKFFEDVAAKLSTDGAAFVSKVNATIGFQVACANNEAVSYVLDLKNGPGSVFVNTGSQFFIILDFKSIKIVE